MVKTSTFTRRLLIWISILLLIIIGIIVFTISGVNTFLKPSIKQALVNVIVRGSDSLYIVSLDDYLLGPGGNSAEFTGVSIQVDSMRYKVLKDLGQLPKLVFSLKVKKASITGINPWQLLHNKNVVCDDILLASLQLNLLQQTKSPDSVKAPSKTLHELIGPDINNVEINSITIKNAEITYRTVQEQTEKKAWWHFSNASALLKNILVDSVSQNDTSRLWFAKDFNVSLGAFSMESSDGLYKLATKNTLYDFKKQTAEIEQVSVIPAVSKMEFIRRTGYAKDIFTAHVASVKINDFNPASVLVDSKIEAGKLAVNEAVVTIYKDNSAPRDMRSKVGKYPHQLLLKAPLDIDIRSLAIAKSKLVVDQVSRKTGEEGSFIFANINGTIQNISNLAGRIKNNKWCKADLRASFMGPNDMRAVFNFDLQSNDGHFTTGAELASLKPEQINPTIKAMARAELENIAFGSLTYHIEGNDNSTTGNMQLLYNGLKVNVLKQKDNGTLTKKGLISFVANLFKIYDDNPMPGKEERKAINYREARIKEKNFFGIITHNMLGCVQQIVLKGKNKTLPGM